MLNKPKMYILFAIISLCIIVLFVQLKKKNYETEPNNQTTQKTEENIYQDMRNMSFTVTPEQLNLKFKEDETKVYGAILDWEMEGATITLVSFETGDASLYLSTGGAVIGGGQHLSVNNASKNYIKLAQNYLTKASKTETKDLPKTKEVYFYLLTNKGVYKGVENMQNFENEKSDWLKLFEKANKVITELRKTTEK